MPPWTAMPLSKWLSSLLVVGLVSCGDSGSDDSTGGGTTGGSSSASSTGPTGPTTAAAETSDAASGTTEPSGSTSGSSGSSGSSSEGESSSATGDPPEVQLPPADGGLDYQLGGAYTPPDGVDIVSRDRNDSPAAGLYNICYVNGFQAQEDEADWWLSEHPDLVLRDGNGDPVIDQDWNEMLLDTSTAEKRTALAEIVGEWISGCGDAGYDAVEIDNLDSYSRSNGLLDQDGAVEYMALLSASAHGDGMAIAQKNSTEIVGRKAEMGTDFVVAEECSRYDECGDYIDGYGDAVLMIEYRMNDFSQGCSDWPNYSIVLRDLDLVPEGSGGYVYDAC